MKIEIELTPDEYFILKAISTRCQIPLRKIFEQFAGDLTNSVRTDGSDERQFAHDYMMRCNYSAPLWGIDGSTAKEKKVFKAQLKKAQKWADKAHVLRKNTSRGFFW